MKKLVASTVVWKAGRPSKVALTKQKWILHPDGKFKLYWNFILIIGVIFSVIIAPYQMAFNSTSLNLIILELIFDCIFFIDIVFSCFTGYYNEDFILITKHSKIIKRYMKSWMIIDILSCFPLQLILENRVQVSSIFRLSRFNQLWRMLRIAKLLRFIRVIKKNSDREAIYDLLKISIQLERLLTFAFLILFLVHIITCFWIFIGKLFVDNEGWIFYFGFNDLSNGELYILSLYWTITTLATVGYGDIYATNIEEQIFAMIVMIIGILSYSYTISSISNIVSALDTRKALFNKKVDILNNLTRKVKVSRQFYIKLLSALEYEHKKNDKEAEIILEDLPLNISKHLVQIIFAQKLENNSFFTEQSTGFVHWVALWLHSAQYEADFFLFKEGEYANEMYFTIKGDLEFVVKINKSWYVFDKIKENQYFGEIDLLFSEHKTRLASVKTVDRCEALSFSREKFEEMMQKFENEAIEIHLRAQKRFDQLNLKMMETLMEADENFAKNEKYENKKSLKRQSIRNITKSISTAEYLKELNSPYKNLNCINKSVNSISLYSDNIVGMTYELLNRLWEKRK